MRLIWDSGEWLWPAAVLGGVCLISLAWSYARNRDRRAMAAGVCKALAFAILCLCLLNPLLSGQKARPGENLLLIVADNSASLRISDGPVSSDDQAESLTGTYAEELADVLDEDSDWLTRLEQDFVLHRYRADERAYRIEDLGTLDYKGTSSNFRTVLGSLGERYADRPVAGLVLLTDGRATDAEAELDLTGLPPVFPVVPTAGDVLDDVRIADVAISESVFEDAPIRLQVKVDVPPTASGTLLTETTDEAGRVLASDRRPLGFSSDSQTADAAEIVRLSLRPDRFGTLFYSVRVDLLDTPDATPWWEDASAERREPTLANNQRRIAVNRGNGRYRVLYVGGRPNWEFKFLRRALAEDDFVKLAGLIRIARKEAKFDFRGRAGENTNPLFRGFKSEADEETESYEQPVIVRLGIESADELRQGFPDAAKELFAFDAVILDDVEREFFTYDQLSLIEEFVTRRGGGLLLLGGPASFGDGGFQKTPIASASPVYFDRDVSPRDSRYRFTLTREGWLEPWTRLEQTQEDERERLAAMPQFHSLSPVSSIKPGARIVAAAVDEQGGRWPVIAEHRYGRGRAAAVMLGDFWKWPLGRQSTDDDRWARSWRQLVRYLISDVPRRVDVELLDSPDVPHARIVQVTALTKAFEPLANATVEITVTQPDGPDISVSAAAAEDRPGVYRAAVGSRMTGNYLAKATVREPDGADVGTESVGWTSDPAAAEFDHLGVDRPSLEEIAEQANGEVLRTDQLEEFARSLPNRDVPVQETWTRAAWHSPWMLVLILSLLVGEWALRRTRGLP